MKNLRINKILTSCLCFNFLIILVILLLQKHLPPVVPLFYGRPQGEEVLTPKIFLLLPAIIAVVFIIINSFIIQFFQDKFLKNVMLGISVVATLFSTITVVKIILLIGS